MSLNQYFYLFIKRFISGREIIWSVKYMGVKASLFSVVIAVLLVTLSFSAGLGVGGYECVDELGSEQEVSFEETSEDKSVLTVDEYPFKENYPSVDEL